MGKFPYEVFMVCSFTWFRRGAQGNGWMDIQKSCVFEKDRKMKKKQQQTKKRLLSPPPRKKNEF